MFIGVRVLKGVARRLAAANSPEMCALRRMKKDLATVRRYRRGHVTVWGWDIEFVDSASCISAFDYIVVRRWLDFNTKRNSPYIIDCGANIGLSVLHFKRLFPESRITAFEADPDICKVLKRNVITNGLKNVDVVERALWDVDGEMQFISDGADGGHLSFAADTTRGRTVRTQRLRGYLREPVDFLKMDTEGSETRILTDCDGFLRNVDSISLEYHSMFEKRQDLDELLTLLTRNGFRYYINSFEGWIGPKTEVSRSNYPYEQLLMISAKMCHVGGTTVKPDSDGAQTRYSE